MYPPQRATGASADGGLLADRHRDHYKPRADIPDEQGHERAERNLDEQRPGPLAATDPVECGEQVRVSGTTVVRGRPSAEPTTIGDRGRDVHAKPAIHPDLGRMAELERQD